MPNKYVRIPGILFNNEEIIENAITTINTKEKKKVKKRKNEENVLIESERMLIVDETEINNSDQNILPENDYMIVTDETEFNNKIVQNILNDNDDDIIDETECNNINKTEKYSTPTDYKTEKKKKKKCDKIIVNDFVMVKFETIKKNIEMFIGQVTEIEENEYTCKFLRKNNQMTGFYCFPFIIDEATISRKQIVKKMVVKKQRRGNFQFQ